MDSSCHTHNIQLLKHLSPNAVKGSIIVKWSDGLDARVYVHIGHGYTLSVVDLTNSVFLWASVFSSQNDGVDGSFRLPNLTN